MKHLEKIITKELLRKVLPKETENLSEDFSFNIYECDEDYIIFSDEGEQLFDYNIYKFAFKCKEWAYKKGYEIHSNFNEVTAIFKEVRKIENVGHFKRLPLISLEEIEYDRDTNDEVEAILKACNWILNQEDS